MRKVRQERNRLENDRKVATKRSNILENTPDLELSQTPRAATMTPGTLGGRRLLRSTDVNNRLVQDRSTPMNIVGSDVEALYP